MVKGIKDVHEQILDVLSRYLSPLNAKGVLSRALARADLRRDQLDDVTAPQVVGNIQRAARLFVDPAALAQLEEELTRLASSGQAPAAVKVQVNGERDIVKARAAGRQICEQLRANAFSVQKVATVVSELARNIVSYAEQGHMEVTPIPGGRARVRIVAVDDGPGIPNLARILSGKYRSKTGLGLGIVGSKRLADKFDIQTGRHGTTVSVEIVL